MPGPAGRSCFSRYPRRRLGTTICPVRSLFASRCFRVAVLLWTAGFFVVFMPAHRRGVIALPGAVQTADRGDEGAPTAYCPLCSLLPRGSERPPADAPVGCAICLLKAGLDLPPTAIKPPAFTALLDYLIHAAPPAAPPLLTARVLRRGRAPPQHHAAA